MMMSMGVALWGDFPGSDSLHHLNTEPYRSVRLEALGYFSSVPWNDDCLVSGSEKMREHDVDSVTVMPRKKL